MTYKVPRIGHTEQYKKALSTGDLQKENIESTLRYMANVCQDCQDWHCPIIT